MADDAIETSAAVVRRAPDRIIEVRIREGAVVDVPEIEEILAAELALGDEPPVVLVDSRRVRSMTRKAQEHSANTAPERKTRAVAILIDSAVSVLLGNFFLHLAHPVYPTRLFREESEARAWLLTHLPETT